jgi:hypothetical protein
VKSAIVANGEKYRPQHREDENECNTGNEHPGETPLRFSSLVRTRQTLSKTRKIIDSRDQIAVVEHTSGGIRVHPIRNEFGRLRLD